MDRFVYGVMNGALGNTLLYVGAGLPAMAEYQRIISKLTHRYRSIGTYTTLQAKAANGNHDAKRVAFDLLLILISGAPLNHAGIPAFPK